MRVLCLSNGHGEDEIAVRILRELRQQATGIEIEALPIVGEGHAYQKAAIPLIGTVKTMPSGGFIYMDGRQLARDIKGGLLKLTLTQVGTVRHWAAKSAAGDEASLVLAVGDIVPLLFAWFSGLPFAFVGTAKSEYYLRDEQGVLDRPWWNDRLERWTNCIYLPWERWLMRRPHCRAVFPRDRITAQFLQQRGIPAVDLGNPMMDGLIAPNQSIVESSSSVTEAPLTLLLLPGSRPPEAYHNWDILLQAVNALINRMAVPLKFLAAIAPSLELDTLQKMLMNYRWQAIGSDQFRVGTGNQQATLVLAKHRFAEYLHQAEVAIAMAGTATEQFVGLGKPVITIPGEGPQFTPQFAEAQTRLLGPSVNRVMTPQQVPATLQNLLQDPDRLHLIAENGHRRMGKPGAAKRIADYLIQQISPQSQI